MIVKAHHGYCPCCEKDTWFVSEQIWLRDYYICQKCKSIPRFRAITNRIKEYLGDISMKDVYEVAPTGAGSAWLQRQSGKYTASHYWTDVSLGSLKGSYYCQNIEKLTFLDESFDLVVTQDVFEHVFNPDLAFKEIYRVLKPGAYHIFTVPYYRGTKTTTRARLNQDGVVEYIKEPVYHGNPVSEQGSLVTYDWGDDIVELIYKWTGMTTIIYIERNEYYGLEADFLEVFISKKAGISE